MKNIELLLFYTYSIFYSLSDNLYNCLYFDWVHLGTLGTRGGELAAAEHPHVLGRSCGLAATSTSASVLP